MSPIPLAWFALLCGVPLAGALLVTVVRGRAGDVVAALTAAASCGVAACMVAWWGISGITVRLGGLPQVDRWAGHPVNLFGFALDPLASLVLLGVVILGFACVLYSAAYVGPRNRELPVPDDRRRYYFWLLLFIGAMAGLVTSSTLFQLFLFWELTTLCSWALIGFYDHEHGALEAAYKAFVMTAGGGLCLLGAILALLALTRSSDFGAFSRLPAPVAGVAAPLLLLLVLLGAWAKSGQVPFHTWLPDAMVAPSPVSAYLHAASMVNAGVYLVLRVALAGRVPEAIATVALVMALVTLAVSVAQFFFQDDLKKLLALSTISHLACVLVGAGLCMAGSTRAAQGAALHILAHGAGKGLLFLSVGSLSYAAGTRRISELSGVLARSPVTAVAFLVGALTVTGVPPFAGFWSKFYLISGAVQLGGTGTAVGVVLLAESVLAFAWFLWVGQKVFLGQPSPAANAMGRVARPMEVSMILLMVLCLAAGAALPLARAIHPAWIGR
jgi:hydrogenase-4 component D